MCGRYTLSTVDGPELAQRFSLITPPEPETLGRFNVCPTETIATVLQPNETASVAWGLRPFRNGKFAPINVRSETAAQRFKWLMTGGRCLVLADGWYEWLKQERKGAPQAAVPLHGRRRRPVRVRRPLRRHRRGDPDHRGQRDLRARPRPHAGRARRPGGRGGVAERGRRRPGGARVPRPARRTTRVSVAPANPAVNKAGVEGAELLTPPDALSRRPQTRSSERVREWT